MRLDPFHGALPERAFRKLGNRLLSLEGGGKDAPPPPDYTGAANATAAGNLDAARATAAANRVNQVTPYGNLTYTHNGTGDDGWTATQTLSPESQKQLDMTNNLQTGLLGTAQTGLGYVNNALTTGGKLDESKLAQSPLQGQAVQDAVLSRLQPQIDRNTESLRTRLANQGLMEGSEGYKNAMGDNDKANNDLYIQAALQGINTGLTARQQGIQEQYTSQDRPLNIVNALRTGNQVQAPQFINPAMQQTTQGADLLGAANAQYGTQMQGYSAEQARNSSTLGSAAMVGAAYFM